MRAYCALAVCAFAASSTSTPAISQVIAADAVIQTQFNGAVTNSGVPGTTGASASATCAVASATTVAVDDGTGAFGVLCSVSAYSGPSANGEPLAIASSSSAIQKTVCLLPLDPTGSVDSALLGTDVVVAFGGASVQFEGTPTFTPNSAVGCSALGSALVQGGVSYYINGIGAGGYHYQDL